MRIKVLIKDPGKAPREFNIENTPETFQHIVGGYIESVTFAEDMCIICNEEGRLMNLPHNCDVCGIDFVGTIILCGVKGEELSDLPGDMESWKTVFRSLWECDHEHS